MRNTTKIIIKIHKMVSFFLQILPEFAIFGFKRFSCKMFLKSPFLLIFMMSRWLTPSFSIFWDGKSSLTPGCSLFSQSLSPSLTAEHSAKKNILLVSLWGPVLLGHSHSSPFCQNYFENGAYFSPFMFSGFWMVWLTKISSFV